MKLSGKSALFDKKSDFDPSAVTFIHLLPSTCSLSVSIFPVCTNNGNDRRLIVHINKFKSKIVEKKIPGRLDPPGRLYIDRV
jgi:hypothetical protein